MLVTVVGVSSSLVDVDHRIAEDSPVYSRSSGWKRDLTRLFPVYIPTLRDINIIIRLLANIIAWIQVPVEGYAARDNTGNSVLAVDEVVAIFVRWIEPHWGQRWDQGLAWR